MSSGLERKVYIICPVQRVTGEESSIIGKYVSRLESEGIKVHWPERDTDQTPKSTYQVMAQNRAAILWADEVHIYYSNASRGSLVDLGMMFIFDKPLKIINPDDVQQTSTRSIENLLLELAEKSKPYFI